MKLSDQHADSFVDERLERIVRHYQELRDPMFGATFQPGSALNLSNVPIEALSSACVSVSVQGSSQHLPSRTTLVSLGIASIRLSQPIRDWHEECFLG